MKSEKRIMIVFLLNLLFSIIEFIGGLITNSVAILSDSIHDIGDAFSIGLACLLEKKSKRKPDNNYTYGYIRYSVLGSIITNFILLIGTIIVIYNAILRLFNPVEINYNGMIAISVLGILINFFAVYFTKDAKTLNQKSVNLHMLEDVLGWIIVLVGSIVIMFTNVIIIDSILSIGVAIFILIKSFENLTEIIDLFLEKTPKNINIDAIKKSILKIDGIIDVHHIHVRSIDGFNNYATMHIIVENYEQEVKSKVKKILEEYDLFHTTIEFENKNECCQHIECQVPKNDNLESHHH